MALQSSMMKAVDVVIVGAGPVGLLLAHLLGRLSIRVHVMEKRKGPLQGSMAIGITPPSLAVFEQLGLCDPFLQRGVPIKTAQVFERGAYAGQLDFSCLHSEHRFVLSLPQSETIRILREALSSVSSVTLFEGHEYMAYKEESNGVTVEYEDGSGQRSRIKTAFLVGCDGHSSRVRQSMGLEMRERLYNQVFQMADFEDHTGLGSAAHIYFGPEGSVESFPLPNGCRRWIVSANGVARSSKEKNYVRMRVRERTEFTLKGSPMFESRFTPTWALAEAYFRGRTMLCGDAAHVMSPIGGQGMNTGFADAVSLSKILHALCKGIAPIKNLHHAYQVPRRKAFNLAARRAAWGMWLGTRKGVVASALRGSFFSGVLLRPPVHDKLAAMFAMQDLSNEPNDIHSDA